MTHITPRTQPAGPTDGSGLGTSGDGTAAGRLARANTAETERSRRLSTETKSALKTTELWIYVAAVAAVLIASAAVGTTASHGDYFRADRAWLYIVILTVGYLVSRGFAKSGSREPCDG
jgi:hypothetical protein